MSAQPMLDLSAQTSFRSAMASVPASVSVVTTVAGGHPHGTTVSAFVSLSMEPMMLLISLDNRSNLLSMIGVGTRLGVNVLGSGHAELAARFAQKGDDKFHAVAWNLVDDAPQLAETHAWVAVDIHELVGAGDHTLLLCDVWAAAIGTTTAPLTYWNRTFGTHVPL